MAKKNSPSKEHLEFLKEVLKQNDIDLQFEISLCLNDIPKDKMVKSAKGKVYVDLIAAIRKEPDQWGRDLKVYCKPSQQDRENQRAKDYVGGGRMITFAKPKGDEPTDEDINNLLGLNGDEQKDNLPY